ncbi:MAG TPA: hypothetical protein VKN14_05840 [Flavobacteriaceae bacterium]|nr:hypothetical protein [Flavobacteriaceae bacterium]
MKNLTIVLFCIFYISQTNAQDTNLIGTWNIIEFTVINGENTNTSTEDILKENKSVWDLTLFEDGTSSGTSNMRNGNMETHESTWKTKNGNLTLTIKVDNRDIVIEYMYEIIDDILVLKRSNPAGTMQIITKFKKGKKV